MNDILNSISATSAFLFGVGIIYIFLDATVGRIPWLHSKFEWRGLEIKDFAFLAVALVCMYYSDLVLPY